jgi:amino acid transporter
MSEVDIGSGELPSHKTDLCDVNDVNRKAVSHLPEHSGLKRTVGFKSVIGLNLASMLGSCLLLPGIANTLTGSSAWLSIIVSGLAVLPACISKGELATAMPYSGGDYVYLARAFGPLLGAITGIGVWLDLLFQAIFGLRGSTEYIKILIGTDTEEWILKIIGLLLLAAVLVLNLIGMKWVKTVTKWYTLFIMIVLLGIGLACFGSDSSSTYNTKNNFITEGPVGFFETAAFVHMGYGGLTKICAVASEVKNPGFNLPWGMLISLFIMVAWFATVTSVMASIVTDISETDYAPFYTIGKAAGNEGLGKFCAVLCVFGMASMGNVSLLAVARFPFAMARDGLVPMQFEAIWHRTSAPWFSLLFCSVVIAIAMVTLPIKQIVKLASAFKIIIFVACNMAIFVFRGRKTEWYKPTWRSPCYPFVQIIGIIFGIALLTLMNIEGVIAAIGIVIIGIIAYMCYGRKYAKFMGVLKPEEYFNIVPLAYLEHEKAKSLERETSLSDQNHGIHTIMIHDTGFLSSWKEWTHEEILFWFAHVSDSRFAKYSVALGKSVPELFKTGDDLRFANDLVLRNLGIDDALDRTSISHELDELKAIEKATDIWAFGARDVESFVESKVWMETHSEQLKQADPDWLDQWSTEMAVIRNKSVRNISVDFSNRSAMTTI